MDRSDAETSGLVDDHSSHYFTAPSDSPRPSHFWATQPAMITGRTARVHAADSRAQNRPSLVMKPTRNTGTVAAWVAVRLTAKKNSFQAKMKQINAVAASPGAIIGRMMARISVNSPAPSIRDASRTSRGNSSRNERIIHTAIGRFIAVYINA